MRIRYFEDTDTLLIEFRQAPVAETRELDEDTMLELDADGNIRPVPARQGRLTRSRACNEAGTGDHRHFGERQPAYACQTPEKLIAASNATSRGGAVKTVTLEVGAPGEAVDDQALA